MPVVFADGIGHYDSAALGNTKIAQSDGINALGTGAFGERSTSGGSGRVTNVGNSAQRETSFWGSLNPGGGYSPLIALLDNGGPQVIVYRGGDGSIQISDGVSVIFGTSAPNVLTFNLQHFFKLSVLHHASAGTIAFQIDGTVVLTLAGKNTARTGNAYSNQVHNYTPAGYLSHFIVADTIGDIYGQPRLGALFPDGAGNYAEWTPSAGANWQNADDNPPDEDTTYNSSATVGQRDSYTMQNTAANTGQIVGLAVTARVKKTDANSRQVTAFLRMAGVDYIHATTRDVPGSYGFLQWIWTLSPATGLAWTKAEVDALEAGIKVIT